MALPSGPAPYGSSCFQQRWPQQHAVPVLLARHPGHSWRRASEGAPARLSKGYPEDGEVPWLLGVGSLAAVLILLA